jgi:multiple sugar transport system ATP-binding protein
MNFIDGRIERGVFVSDWITIPIDRADATVTLGIRPEHVYVSTTPLDGAIPASVYVTELMGNETFVFLSVGPHKMIARAPADFRAEVNCKVWLRLETGKAHFFPKEQSTDYTDQKQSV